MSDFGCGQLATLRTILVLPLIGPCVHTINNLFCKVLLSWGNWGRDKTGAVSIMGRPLFFCAASRITKSFATRLKFNHMDSEEMIGTFLFAVKGGGSGLQPRTI